MFQVRFGAPYRIDNNSRRIDGPGKPIFIRCHAEDAPALQKRVDIFKNIMLHQ